MTADMTLRTATVIHWVAWLCRLGLWVFYKCTRARALPRSCVAKIGTRKAKSETGGGDVVSGVVQVRG